MKATKTRKQVTVHENFRDMVETQISVGFASHLHKETRSKKPINCLYNIGLTISYAKVMKIENRLENAGRENIESNGGTFIPSTLEIRKRLHFAIDNIYLKNDTANGKFKFHGTILVAFQTKSNKKNELLKITPCKSFSIKPTANQSLESLVKPAPPNEKFPSYKSFKQPSSLIDLSSSCTADRLWGLCQVIQRDDICPLPAWNAFNSLTADKLSQHAKVYHYYLVHLTNGAICILL